MKKRPGGFSRPAELIRLLTIITMIITIIMVIKVIVVNILILLMIIVVMITKSCYQCSCSIRLEREPPERRRRRAGPGLGAPDRDPPLLLSTLILVTSETGRWLFTEERIFRDITQSCGL